MGAEAGNAGNAGNAGTGAEAGTAGNAGMGAEAGIARTDGEAGMDGGEALLEACRDLGVDYVFSSPGSEWAPAWEAFARQRERGLPGPRYLDLTHETLAVAMAAGYGLVAGRPQAVLLHAGPGLLQGACALHGALLAGVPMLVCSAESISYGDGPAPEPGSQWYRNLSVVGGPHAMAAPFVKWASSAASSAVLYQSLTRAGELAQRATAGPAYLSVPVEVLLQPWVKPAHAHRVPAPGVTASPVDEVATAAARLLRSRAPVVVTESAGRDENAWGALVELAELLAIPVIEPQSAVSANFPRSHPLHQGGALAAIADDADLVLLVSCRAPWYPPSARPPHAEVLVVDAVPHRPYMDYQVLSADQYLEGDVASNLRALTAAVRSAGIDGPAVARRRAALAESHRVADDQRRTAEEQAGAAAAGRPPDAVCVVAALRELLDPDAVVVDETITHSRVVQRHLQADRPGRYVYVQGGLGQGAGVALGVKLAVADRQVAFVVGDGSFLYNPVVPALMASRQYRLPLLIVVLNNKQYLSMKLNHLRAYPDGAAASSGTFLGVDLSAQPELSELAAPFGMLGLSVSAGEELRPALCRALQAVREGQTAIVNVLVAR
jgi:acetolactate synthase I/II/III large subunit